MEITLKWLITKSKLDGLRCVVCEDKLDKLVKGINVLDDFESIRWVKSNELVLFTAHFLQAYLEGQMEEELIQILSEINCAGIGIRVSQTMKEVPEEILLKAEMYKLPVIEIPFFTTFADITSAVFDMSFNLRAKRLQEEQKLIRKLFSSFGDDYDLEKMLQPISDFFESMVLVINSANICLASAMDKENICFVRPGDVINIEIEKRQYGLIDVRGKKFRCYIHVFPNDKGYLLIRVGKTDLKDNQKMIVQNIGNILSANLEKIVYNHRTDIQTNAGLIDFFLEEKEHMPEEIIQQCHFYHFPYSMARICIIFQMKFLTTEKKEQMLEYLKQLHLKQQVDRYLKGATSYMCMNDTICSIFLFYDRTYTRPVVTRAAEKFAIDAANGIKKLTGEEVRIGIGRCHQQLSNLPLSFREALNALRMKPYTHTGTLIGCYSHQLHYQLLSACTNEDLLFMWFDHANTLDKYDKTNSTDLVNTLCIYVENLFNASQAAQQLFIHRNTLMRRLNKIEEILCISMESFNEVMSVYLSICAYRILQ